MHNAHTQLLSRSAEHCARQRFVEPVPRSGLASTVSRAVPSAASSSSLPWSMTSSMTSSTTSEPTALRPRSAWLSDPDPAFAAVCDAFSSHGGMVSADHAWATFEHNRDPDVARLARWIVERRVVHFYWNDDTWLPLFQFDRHDMTVKPTLQPVFAELNNVYDRWTVAKWFALPHRALGGCTPVAVFAADPHAVWTAAKRDRCVAND
jgi:hypothetical protein